MSLTSPEAANKLLTDPLKHVWLDIDGVLWSGDTIIKGAPEAVALFRSRGLNVRFITNNASLSRSQQAKKLVDRGFSGTKESEVYNSAYAAALRLRSIVGQSEKPDGKKQVFGNVLVVGESGLHDELQSVLADGYITYGLELQDPEKVGGYQMHATSLAWRENILPAPIKKLVVRKDGDSTETVQAGSANARKISLMDLNPVAVVVGLDLHFSILKCAIATMAIHGPPPAIRGNRKPTIFVATNEDPQIPVGPDSALLPGAGCMIASIATAVGRAPDLVCGKPYTAMAEALIQMEGVKDPKKTCLAVGDRLTTDVAFGNRAGASTVLVLSGAESMEDVNGAIKDDRKDFIPTYILNSIADFIPK